MRWFCNTKRGFDSGAAIRYTSFSMSELEKPTVLVVDDDPIIALLNTKRFEREGFVVFPAATLYDAIGALIDKKPTVVATDGDLGSGGIGDAVRLAEVAREHHVPVVLFSTHTPGPEVAELFSGAFTKEDGRAFVGRVVELGRSPHQ